MNQPTLARNRKASLLMNKSQIAEQAVAQARILCPELAQRIIQACANTQPRTKSRRDALANIKWCLKASGQNLYVALGGGLFDDIPLVSKDKALVFDARDNEQLKILHYEMITHLKLEIELC